MDKIKIDGNKKKNREDSDNSIRAPNLAAKKAKQVTLRLGIHPHPFTVQCSSNI